METKLTNPVCPKCKDHRKGENYKWECLACHTKYSAVKYRRGKEEWFEYEPEYNLNNSENRFMKQLMDEKYLNKKT